MDLYLIDWTEENMWKQKLCFDIVNNKLIANVLQKQNRIKRCFSLTVERSHRTGETETFYF